MFVCGELTKKARDVGGLAMEFVNIDWNVLFNDRLQDTSRIQSSR